MRRRRVWLALFLSIAIVLMACVLGQRGGWLNYPFAIFVLDPGIMVCRWFMDSRFATPTIRLVIIGIVTVLIYWPMLFYVLEIVSDGKRVVRSLTPIHALSALGAGAVTSLAAF